MNRESFSVEQILSRCALRIPFSVELQFRRGYFPAAGSRFREISLRYTGMRGISRLLIP